MTAVQELLGSLLQPGETIVLAGRRGHGKTATAVSMCQRAMGGEYGHRRVYVITNVVFGRARESGPPEEAYPPGVFHEDTLAGTMRRIGEILGRAGRSGALIIWLLDEAQNYMLADQNGSKENMALTKYLGNARKFGVCNLFLTPTVNNLAPRVRCFPTGEAKSGYCSCQMVKDKTEAAAIACGRADPRSVTFVRTSADEPWTPVLISPSPWIRDVYSRDAAPGDYGYDTISTATFSVGENAHGVPFSFERFIRATSGGLSHELPEKIAGFFREWDAEGAEDGKAGDAASGDAPSGPYCYTKEDLELAKVKAVRNRRMAGDTWPQIAAEWGEPPTTLQYQLKKWSQALGPPDGEQSGTAADGRTAASRARNIYKTYKGGRRGPPACPRPSEGEA
ncbi:hypothetical protein AUQ37_02675 [Candidatus Methanomethylophilus sp. 1R26]|uniref:ATP-binding protein n=1 Tax=Candidatus Methanomethylophilus sp. 1R26 TaxID=1769296 RepID=UPI0007375281|nr:ATP-binding protein [Candidatus Methanomethylophilus sp. 1R26]KUE73350.1 hypothetical protein AUQ37_02675 [Candidatus Methanomethylophilus sp. 1R26]